MKWFIVAINLDGTTMPPLNEQTLVESIGTPYRQLNTHLHYEPAISALVIDALAIDIPQHMCTVHHQQTIIGDIRLDNRDVLLTRLTKSHTRTTDYINDLELALELILLHGINIVYDFVGEFAFVIWDERERKAIAVRDHIGMRTLFWTKKQNTLWISSDLCLLKDVFSLEQINTDYLMDFYLCNGHVDKVNTPYNNVYRLPSASWLEAINGSVHPHKYWNLYDQCEELRYRDVGEYESHFRELVVNAVKRRMTPSLKHAVLMSGGLDSTLLYGIAKTEMPAAQTIPVSGVFDRWHECDEREYIYAVLDHYNSRDDAVFEVCDDYGTFHQFPSEYIWTYEPAVTAATSSFTSSLIRCASSAGAKQIFTGYGSDHLLTGSFPTLADMLHSGKISLAVKEASQLASRYRLSTPKLLAHYGIGPLIGRGWAKELRKHGQFIEELKHIPSYNQQEYYRQFKGTMARLFSDRVLAAKYGVTMQHPFLDRELVEFLFRVPGEVRFQGNMTKPLLRKSMGKYLPQQIIERKNKTGHLPLTHEGLKQVWNEVFNVATKGRIRILNIISHQEWLQALYKFRHGMIEREDMWVLLALELWLYKLEEQIGVELVH
ncbi:asparagine synthetase B [Paenibacillus baekrokdamisoli]|uniref:asparagine synthase (glutamine-hydrolyzing) n=1 Tax=Paenibacillus baekrokdamisoli TaxID=1712516 RepID=A0A3G9J124_9BACL|nr:asparagine synthase-related protein [Paenibacillus baekrokdamisoli]MBB3070998.1 asparagine synthetase B (glutamine-hydrolyzing) [Paenibacillus baekrokdamisoli]BBH22065.1 asparagine synthetase B [Paenibacillus baekrokdamisoli]